MKNMPSLIQKADYDDPSNGMLCIVSHCPNQRPHARRIFKNPHFLNRKGFYGFALIFCRFLLHYGDGRTLTPWWCLLSSATRCNSLLTYCRFVWKLMLCVSGSYRYYQPTHQCKSHTYNEYPKQNSKGFPHFFLHPTFACCWNFMFSRWLLYLHLFTSRNRALRILKPNTQNSAEQPSRSTYAIRDTLHAIRITSDSSR